MSPFCGKVLFIITDSLQKIKYIFKLWRVKIKFKYTNFPSV